MSDLISRADAICEVLVNDGIDNIVDRINELPSAELPKGDLISRADVLKYPIRLDHYDEVNGNRLFVYGVESVIEYVESLPSADAESDDLIIKGAKGIQDGLYNIKDGKLFMYKANGGTVRTYPIVPSADYEDIIKDYRKQYENMNNEIADLEAKLSADAVDVAHDIPEYCSWSQTYTNMVQSAMSKASADRPQGRLVDAGYLERKYMEADYLDNDSAYDVIAEIDNAPTVSADRPQGEWIQLEQQCEYRCSNCGKIVFADDENELNYCCSCGAYMNTPKGFVADEWYREEFGEDD